MDERLALNEIQRIDRRVRAESWWYGVYCLIIAVAVFAYVIITHVGQPGIANVPVLLAVAFAILGTLYWRYGRHQQAVSHTQAHLDVPMGLSSIALIFIAIGIRHWLLPDGFTVWLLLTALLPAMPCLIGAWKVFRA